jgi:hypothetical protein
MSTGTVELQDTLTKATSGDREAVAQLFQGFFADDEVNVDCGYFGTLGFIFVEHSFWCITDTRICTLRIKRGGEMFFQSCLNEHIKSDAFYQPSLLALWLLIIGVAISTWGIGLLLTPMLVKAYYKTKKSGLVFWVEDGIPPIYIFADRNNLANAQNLSVKIGAQRVAAA